MNISVGVEFMTKKYWIQPFQALKFYKFCENLKQLTKWITESGTEHFNEEKLPETQKSFAEYFFH